MNPKIRINNSAGCCRIEIEGTIGVPEEWQFDTPDARVATYERFRETVRRIEAVDAAEVVVEIRSTGGDVNDALLIHDALRALPGRVTTRCYGYTASAATLIAQAASEGCREISANALYLVHDAVCAAEGNAAELAGTLDLLKQTDERIAAVYAARSGRETGHFRALMSENNGAGRWLSPEETVAEGLADRIVDEAAEASGTVHALARNLVRGWRKLLSRTETGRGGTVPAGQRPGDRNLLHPVGERRYRTVRAAEEARARAQPTATRPTEDPPADEPLRTANQRAYDDDARRMRG